MFLGTNGRACRAYHRRQGPGSSNYQYFSYKMLRVIIQDAYDWFWVKTCWVHFGKGKIPRFLIESMMCFDSGPLQFQSQQLHSPLQTPRRGSTHVFASKAGDVSVVLSAEMRSQRCYQHSKWRPQQRIDDPVPWFHQIFCTNVLIAWPESCAAALKGHV